ncbi:hypothetical protein LJR237_001722 [Bosea sp. LjRoot237]
MVISGGTLAGCARYVLQQLAPISAHTEAVYGLERQSGSGVDMDMKELTRRVVSELADHRDDREL